MIRLATAGALALLLAACGDPRDAETRCVLSDEQGSERTRVSDCEVALADGSRVRLALVRHRDDELGTLDVAVVAYRLHEDGRVERLSAEQASAMIGASPH